MEKEKICEINVEKLMGEYQNLFNEILIKKSYLDGVKSKIAEEVKEYFCDYRGKYYRMNFEGKTSDDAIVRIGKISVSFLYSSLYVTFYLVVNPYDLSTSIKWTDKEKKLLEEAKKYWTKSDYDWCVEYFSELEAISNQLKCLKNKIYLVVGNHYSFSDAELMTGRTVCKASYILGERHGQNVMLDMFENM